MADEHASIAASMLVARSQRSDGVSAALADRRRTSNMPADIIAGRELPGELVHLRDHRVPRRRRVGAGRLEHADDGRVVMVELATQGVVAGAELDARDVGKPHDLAVRAGFQYD